MYKIQLKFNFGKDLKLTSSKMQPCSSIGKKQFLDFVLKFEEHRIGKICVQFPTDCWNHLIKSC